MWWNGAPDSRTDFLVGRAPRAVAAHRRDEGAAGAVRRADRRRGRARCARGRRVQGAFLAVPFPAGDRRARYAFRRALATTGGTIDANAIVVDIDPERSLALLHAIDPNRKTGREV